jgi:hypothetical protein
VTIQAFYDLKIEVREYFDAKKVLPKISGKRPGKKCGKGYIAAERKCKGHYSESGKLTEEGKASAQELAGKVRARKGMPELKKALTKPQEIPGKAAKPAKAEKQKRTKKPKIDPVRFHRVLGTDPVYGHKIQWYKAEDVLGIEPGAPVAEAKKKYFAIAKQLHPDANPGLSPKHQQENAEKLSLVTEAYRNYKDEWENYRNKK